MNARGGIAAQGIGKTAGKDRSALFLATYLSIAIATVYIRSPIISSFDSRWVVPQAVSLLRHGDLNLDEYGRRFSPGDLSVQYIDRHYYSQYPIGVPLIAAPIVLVLDRIFLRYGVDLEKSEEARTSVEFISAVSITTAAAFFTYLLAFVVTASNASAVIVCLIFAFCTSAWSTASRGLWQHGPSLLVVSAGIYYLLLSRTSRRWLYACGACIAMAYAVRPSNWIVVCVVTVYLVWSDWRAVRPYLCGAAPVALAFLAYNFWIYGLPLSPYYLGYVLDGSRWVSYARLYPSVSGLAGNLVSPSRGLLVYSPVFVFCIYSVARKVKAGRMSDLDWLAASAVVGEWIVISLPRPWWGGHCYRPRMFTDALPWLCVLLAGEVRLLKGDLLDPRTVVFALLACVSAGPHFIGTTSVAANQWSWTLTDVSSDDRRVWDWKDIPFLRPARGTPQPSGEKGPRENRPEASSR